MPEIRVIEPIIFAPAEKLRVCAYARVSSDSTDQRNSFASQVNYYTKYIQAHEGWTFVDIYADQGITGTSALKRDEFLRLMRDCRQGKIDRILVKSVSRFARNAQDCIEAVRELRQLGVTVYFEKEHINTANMSNEMFLSMMSAFAQEESISISKNMRKGAVMRMKNGTFRLSQAPYGYYLDEKGILIVQQEESKIVQRIFGNFLSGMGIQEIAAELQKEHIPKLNGEPIWSYTIEDPQKVMNFKKNANCLSVQAVRYLSIAQLNIKVMIPLTNAAAISEQPFVTAFPSTLKRQTGFTK